MQKIKDFIYYNRKEIIGIIVIGVLLTIIIFQNNLNDNNIEEIKIEKEEIKEGKKEENTKIIVDIKGEIKTPGIYELEEGKRIKDVIELAGGLTEKADTSEINLSEKVIDEMLIIIPTIEENKDQSKKDNNSVKKTDNRVSINNASLSELMTIKGIGETKASNIIEYRNKNGKFKSIEDLKKVNGIGNSTFEKIKDYIKL